MNSFQSEDNGLFYEPVIKNTSFNDSDWWGDRHLALHAVSAYCTLGAIPKYMSNYNWHGIIDEIYIYDIALTDDEVMCLFNEELVQ